MRYVVSYMNYSDNNLTSKIVEASTEVEAATKLPELEWLNHVITATPSVTLNELQDIAFDGDSLFAVIAVD